MKRRAFFSRVFGAAVSAAIAPLVLQKTPAHETVGEAWARGWAEMRHPYVGPIIASGGFTFNQDWTICEDVGWKIDKNNQIEIYNYDKT